KFKIGRSAEDTGWEQNNRQFSAAGEDTVLATVFFDNDTVVSEIKDGSIEFVVNMVVIEELGLYDPEVDSLEVRGDFNGWSDSDPDISLMNQNFLDPNEWFLEVPFKDTPVGETKNFKYYVKLADEESIWEDGWERPLTHGGGNRMVDFEGIDGQLYDVLYDDIDPDWVLIDGVDLQVTFNVDMRPAMDPLIQATPFNPDADTLWWIGEQPVFVASQGWVDSDNIKELYFEDLDGDSIYSGTMTVQEPSFNAFEYRYGYYSESAEGWQLEPTGYANFASRVRYAGQDAARSWPVSPWPMPVDTWTATEVKSDQETDPEQSYLDYLAATSIGDLGEIRPDKFRLYNNYPNPFNPSTNLKFDLPEAGDVKLFIYNVLGQKVATVYDGNLKAGQH
ncbi:T9SS type A sorting domain-containing protein, partial [bacterium]|nr:T9SS type A sorting domain-containing protein [bacterium]